MSYLTDYRPFLSILLLFGICPFTVHTRTKLIQLCPVAFTYTIALYTVTLSFVVALFILRISSSLHELHHIQVLANLLQGIACAGFHFALTATCLWQRKSHAHFLNEIVLLDGRIDAAILAPRPPPLRYRIIVENVLFSVGYFTVKWYIDGMVEYLQPKWFNFVWIRLTSCIMLTQCLLTMHLRFCCLLLTQRYAVIRKNVWSHASAMLELFDGVFRLQREFEQVFGSVILIDSLMDLIMLTVTIYMTIWFAVLNRDYEYVGLTIVMFALPVMKQVLFVWAANGFGHQV